MYLYFNKQGILTTTIPHGEPVRQGSTLNLYICFDSDYFSGKEEVNNLVISGNLILPGSNNQTTDFVFPIDGYPSNCKIFEKLIDSEITYDLIPGNYYWIFKLSLAPEVSTVNSGKLIINIKIEKPSITGTLDDQPIIEHVDYLGRADVYVEKTYGNATIVSNISERHYENLVNQFKELLATINSNFLKIPKPGNIEYDNENQRLVIESAKGDSQFSKIYLYADGRIELVSQINGQENFHTFSMNGETLDIDGETIALNSDVKKYSAPLVVIKESDFKKIDYYSLIKNNSFYTENRTPIIILHLDNSNSYYIADNVSVNSAFMNIRLRTEFGIYNNLDVHMGWYIVQLWKNMPFRNEILEYSTNVPTLDNFNNSIETLKNEITINRIGLLKVGDYEEDTGEIEFIYDEDIIDTFEYDEDSGILSLTY